uniref:Uncharacterized protein n=1 Tax=Lupinus angustifolius TaxID=3871 RepID=L0P0V1_LUPAN|nr:hypothetical protein [Lupinus angustifolius]
MAQELEPLIST